MNRQATTLPTFAFALLASRASRDVAHDAIVGGWNVDRHLGTLVRPAVVQDYASTETTWRIPHGGQDLPRYVYPRSVEGLRFISCRVAPP